MTIQFFGLPFLSGKPLPRGNPSCCQSDTPIRSRWTTKSFQLLCVLNAHAHMNNPLSDGRWNDGDAVQQDSPFMRNSNHKIHKMLSTPMGPYQFCRQTNPTFRTPEIRWFPEPLRPCTLGLRHQIKLPGPGGSKIFQNGYQKQHRFCQISSNCCICIKMIHPSKFHMGRSFGTLRKSIFATHPVLASSLGILGFGDEPSQLSESRHFRYRRSSSGMNWSHIGQRPPLKAALEPQHQGIFGWTVDPWMCTICMEMTPGKGLKKNYEDPNITSGICCISNNKIRHHQKFSK